MTRLLTRKLAKVAASKDLANDVVASLEEISLITDPDRKA
jgi:hypothetical protein